MSGQGADVWVVTFSGGSSKCNCIRLPGIQHPSVEKNIRSIWDELLLYGIRSECPCLLCKADDFFITRCEDQQVMLHFIIVIEGECDLSSGLHLEAIDVVFHQPVEGADLDFFLIGSMNDCCGRG